MLVFVTWRIGEVWFSRDQILEAAPEGTILAVNLKLTGTSLPIVKNFLEGVPLLSNRSLDFQDIASLTHGELAFFLTSTGEKAVGIRANRAELPQELLTSLAITVQEVTPDILLLSQTLLPISGMNSSTHAPFFPSLTSDWLGRIDLPVDHLSGSILASNGQLEMIFPSQKKQTVKKDLLSQTLLALSGHGSELSPPLGEGTDAFEQIFGQEWEIVVAQDELGSPALLVKAPQADTTQEDLLGLLQLMGAYLSPTLKETELKDGTSLKEILVDPSFQTVEQVQLGQIEAFRVVASHHSIYGAFFDHQVIFSTSEDLITKLSETSLESACHGNVLDIEPGPILKQMNRQVYSPTLFLMTKIFSQFSEISIEMNRYSSTAHFCST